MSTSSFTKFNNKKVVLSLLFSALLITGCSTGSDLTDNHTHNFVVEKGVQATCTEDGTTSKVYCSECGYVLTDHKVVKALGHHKVEAEEKEPGITKDGLTEGVYCDRCGEIFESIIPVPHQSFPYQITSTVNSDNSITFTWGTHKDVPFVTNIEVKGNQDDESYVVEEGNSWTYNNFNEDIVYTFTFDVEYEDEDHEEQIVINRFRDNSENKMPLVTINTEDWDPILNKQDYVKATFSMDDNMGAPLNNLDCSIRLRGSTTAQAPKKPFRIKFDKKTSLFGLEKAKSWVLLANYYDKSLSRNDFAFSLAHDLYETTVFNPTPHYVELMVNNEYLGVYTLCEQMQTGKGRVIIDETLNNTDIGYFLEIDNKYDKDDFVFEKENMFFNIKTPDVESAEYLENPDVYLGIIADNIDSIIQALNDHNWSEITNLVDIDSFVSSYIVQEITANPDVGETSFYIYRDIGGKLVAGPVWDFDISIGNTDYKMGNRSECPPNNQLWASERNYFFKKLLENTEFTTLLKEKMGNHEGAILNRINYYKTTSSTSPCVIYKNSFDREDWKWKIMGLYIWPEPDTVVALDTREEQIDYMTDWLEQRWAYMKECYEL